MSLALIGIIIAAVVTLGMSSCAFNKGEDHGFHKRDDEVAAVQQARADAETRASNAEAALDSQNKHIEDIAKLGKAAQSMAATAIAQSKAREAAERTRRDSLLAIVQTGGTEKAANCPKTAATLGDLSDIMRDGIVAPVAVPAAPAQTFPPVGDFKPTPLPPKPALPTPKPTLPAKVKP